MVLARKKDAKNTKDKIIASPKFLALMTSIFFTSKYFNFNLKWLVISLAPLPLHF